MFGTAQEASTCSTRMGSRADTNLASAPLLTFAAPSIRTGRCGRGPHAAISAKSMCFSSNPRKSEKPMRWPVVMNSIIDCMIGDEGLSCRVGIIPAFTSRTVSTMKRLMACSTGPWAVFSSQKSIIRFQTGRSPFMNEYQSSVAHTAPPEVPLMATNSNSSRSRAWAWQSAFSAPAVKAVWLPPPWQAMAILVLGITRSSIGGVAL